MITVGKNVDTAARARGGRTTREMARLFPRIPIDFEKIVKRADFG